MSTVQRAGDTVEKYGVPSAAASSAGTTISGAVGWFSGAGAPTNGAAGTQVGVAGPGSRYFDSTNTTEYWQSGSISSVSWVATLAP